MKLVAITTILLFVLLQGCADPAAFSSGAKQSSADVVGQLPPELGEPESQLEEGETLEPQEQQAWTDRPDTRLEDSLENSPENSRDPSNTGGNIQTQAPQTLGDTSPVTTMPGTPDASVYTQVVVADDNTGLPAESDASEPSSDDGIPVTVDDAAQPPVVAVGAEPKRPVKPGLDSILQDAINTATNNSQGSEEPDPSQSEDGSQKSANNKNIPTPDDTGLNDNGPIDGGWEDTDSVTGGDVGGDGISINVPPNPQWPTDDGEVPEEEPTNLVCGGAYDATNRVVERTVLDARRIAKTHFLDDSQDDRIHIYDLEADVKIKKIKMKLNNPNGKYCFKMKARIIKIIEIDAACGAEVNILSLDARKVRRFAVNICD